METAAEAIVNRIAPSAPVGLMNPKQAAEYLQVMPQTLAVWRSTNRVKLAYVKYGTKVMYRREDLEKFVADSLRNAA